MRILVTGFFDCCRPFQEKLSGYHDHDHRGNRHANDKRIGIQFDPDKAARYWKS
tara:strand:+ start:2951 stop:3112 length:162 start_codon:yes stop_codon:yes gene_type:complete